jgi:hypothetical protein
MPAIWMIESLKWWRSSGISPADIWFILQKWVPVISVRNTHSQGLKHDYWYLQVRQNYGSLTRYLRRWANFFPSLDVKIWFQVKGCFYAPTFNH